MQKFIKNNKMILTHFKLHYKKLIFFTIISIFIATMLMFLFSMDTKYKYLSPTNYLIIEKSNDGRGSISNGSVEIWADLSGSVLGIVGFIFFSILAIVFTNVVIVDEFRNNNIVYWMTTSNSRLNIILSKLAFILISIIGIFIPYFLITILFSLSAKDFNDYGKYIFLRGLYFLIFILLFTSIFSITAILLIDKFAFFLSMCIFLVVYTVAINMVKNMLPNEEWIKYVSPLSLLAQPLEFGEAPDIHYAPDMEMQTIFKSADPLSVNNGWNIGSTFINLTVITTCSASSVFIYKNLDFNI